MSSADQVNPTIEQRAAECAQRVGPIELREGALPILSCLASFLRWNGISIQYEDLLDIAPVSFTRPTPSLVSFLCRHIGIQIRQVGDGALTEEDSFPILVKEPSGYFLLLLEPLGTDFMAVLPGIAISPRKVARAAHHPDRAYYALRISSKAGPAFVRRYRQARLFLIPWKPEYTGKYSKTLAQQVNKVFSAARGPRHKPGALPGLTIDAVLEAHRQICPSLPEYYGCYRQINLRRNMVFIDYRSAPAALEELLHTLTSLANRPLSKEETIYYSARCLVDFLTIHPFINGNRRIGMLLTAAFASTQGVDIDWDKVSRSQIYYATRLGCKGHFRQLERLLTAAAGPI